MIKIFLAFVKKEIYHILRDTRTLIILFAMPVVLVLIFGYAVSNEFKGASMSIYDEAKDELSRELIQHVSSSGHFQIVELVNSIDELDATFKSGKAKIGLVIPSSFEQQFFKENSTSIQIITDATEPNYAETLTNYCSEMIRSFQSRKSGIEILPYQI